ncbi:unnamed protein product [Adineta steineri]|uniref:GIY-YIG domain-containing protein n=1 Tax=Adineta steineri TaxID=433720 RepID=A0A815KSG4_9BILA|nr:unnamed protein product [Adineta steineri]
MDTFDYPVIIKQESLSLPTSSPFIYKILNTNDSIMPIVPNIKVESEDLMEIARQKKFNLIIPSEHEEPNKKFRLVRKAFAIVCRSNMTKDDIMQHIHREFNLLVQYICISSPNELPTCSSSKQLARREKDVYPLAYTINETNSEIPSYFRIEYHSFITSSINKYHVDGAIIDYNLDRMLVCFRIFAEDCIRRLKNKPEQFILNHIQKQIALEFYLQFDVDVFFMKTCSFRGAEPRSADEGLFCRDEPDARYGLFECGRCPLCKPLHNTMRYRQQPTIRFYAGYTHRFLNGYKSILNCDANCKTPNIIYVMTCPCGKFEYIGETGQRLNDRLWYHRKHANRIIHEFLIGEKNVELTRNKVKDFETNVKDRMLLYKHAARCPSTIQTFLNFNPTCSCFVPIPINEIDPQNERYSLPPSLMLLDRAHPTSIAPKDKNAIKATLKTRADELVRTCMRNLPYPPKGFGFSRRQRVEQYQYFKAKKDILPKLDQSVNLFNVAIIAVLPLNVSEVVRRFIEALFITHTEAKLNTFGRLCHDNDDDDNNNNNNEKNYVNSNTILGRGYWCRNIVFPH